MGLANTKEESCSDVEESSNEEWLLIEHHNGDDEFETKSVPMDQEPLDTPTGHVDTPTEPVDTPTIHVRPCVLDIPCKSKQFYEGPTLPSIEEHPLELSSQSEESIYDHMTEQHRSISTSSHGGCPGISLTSLTSGISHTTSIDSSTEQHNSHVMTESYRPHLPSYDVPSDCERGCLSSGGFQLDSLSDRSIQGTLVESILLDAERVLRDDGFLAAVKHIQAHIDQECGHNVTHSLLHEACTQGIDLFIFNIALMKTDKAMVNYQNEKLRTPLHIACSHLPVIVNDNTRWLHEQQMAKIRKLLSLESDTTLQDEDGNTPLHLATFHSNTDCIQLILNHNPDCRNMQNSLGNTALHIASRDNFLGVVKVICDHTPDARILNTTKKQRCPIHQAISKGHTKVVEVLLNFDPGLLTCADGKGMQPLHLAIKRRSLPISMIMLQQDDCPITTPDNEGQTPLHYVCEWGNVEILKVLINKESSRGYLNTQDINGDTALHIAYRHGNRDLVKLLKTKQASKKIMNNYGEMANKNIAAGHMTTKNVAAGHMTTKKGIGKLGALFKKKKDHVIPKLSGSDSLVSSTK